MKYYYIYLAHLISVASTAAITPTTGPIVNLGYGLWKATINVRLTTVKDLSLCFDTAHETITGDWKILQLQQHPLRTATNR